MELKNDLDYPLVSIITVTLNSEKTVRDTIESVLNQTYKNIEYIIVDGCSSDKTLEIVNEYKGSISKIISEPDSGIYDAMNKGISLAKGVLIGIINSDDYYLPGSVDKVVQMYQLNPDFAVFHGKLKMTNREEGYEFIITPTEVEKLKYSMPLCHPACFVKKKIYQTYNGFSTYYQLASDRDFLLRLYLAEERFYFIPEILAVMREGGFSQKALKIYIKENFLISYRNKGNIIIIRKIVIRIMLGKFSRHIIYILRFTSFLSKRDQMQMEKREGFRFISNLD